MFLSGAAASGDAGLGAELGAVASADVTLARPIGEIGVRVGQFVRLEVGEGVGTIRLDRPPMNALSTQVQREIREASLEAAARSDIRAVIVYGGPKVFAAGADVKEMADWSYTDAVDHSVDLTDCFAAVARIPKPSIAAITGYALGGGCELAMCCDLRICGDNARMGQPEILLGVIPGAGGTQRLSRLVGPSRAKDLIFSGRFADAQEAHRIGLVDRVVAPDDVYDEALAWASTFASGPAYALRAAKEAIDAGLDTDLDTGLGIERVQFAALFATQDRAEGMRSFIDKGPGKAEFEGA
ncbi:MAG: enoyl-CoA hydratase-related protein [Candidatus Nanopelagicales bacterium]|nr:enoyl-CoA hydratase-related protein [Candidatus Nanopelagicales bacterium]